jgi:hypothetical protein
MKHSLIALLVVSFLLSACTMPGGTPVPEETAVVDPTAEPTEPPAATQPPVEPLISTGQEYLHKQLAYIPPPPITPIPSSIQNIYGNNYLVYHTEPDPFRIVCPQEGCGFDERLIHAIYAGTKVRLQKLIRVAGVDIVDEFKPLDIHLVSDANCTRPNWEWGSAGTYTPDAQDAYICLYLGDTETFKDSGVFGPIQVDPQNPLTPETAIRLGGAGVIGHEYGHVLFFNRHQFSSEEYVNTLDYAATTGATDARYLDLCDPINEYSAGPLHQLCKQYGFTLADFRTALIELDRLDRAGHNQPYGMTTMNQMRAVVQSIIGQDPFSIYNAAGYYYEGDSTEPYQSPFANESCTNRAEIVEDVTAPDGTMFDVNAPFEKTWRIQNTGSCSWDGYSLAFIGQDRMSGPDSIPVPATASGATVNLSIPLQAPSTPGVHVGHWRLRTAAGEFFGPIINTTIYTRPGCSVAPQMSFFKGTPETVGPNAIVLLEWGQITNVDKAEITPEIGAVDVNGGRLLIEPKQTTTFTLTATCGAQTTQQQVTVNVDPSLPPFAITSLTAQAAPEQYVGACINAEGVAARIDFAATVTANGPGVILYKWNRSDGAIYSPYFAIVDSSQPLVVTTYWSLSASVSEYQEFEILAPTTDIPPSRASFTLACTP